VASWRVVDQELLFVSPKNTFTVGKPIRGGIPIVFPQFGPGKLPQHGFARNKLWKHGETTVNKATGDITTAFHLTDDAETMAVWPHKFELVLTLVLKATSLSQQLTVKNTGTDSFNFATLFHTYFHVDNILTTQVFGLKGVAYLDKTKGGERVEETNEPVVFRGEVDRVYIDGGSREVRIADDGNAEVIVKAAGFRDVVVWNPHADKAKAMGDLGEENYPKFVCVETGSVNEELTLQAGGQWEAAQGLSLRIKGEAGSSK